MTSPSGRDRGVRTLAFSVARAGEDVPAILWLPGRPGPRRPLVLIGHGGGMHKRSPFIERLGSRLAAGPGFACLAIDLPFHGERTPSREIGLSGLVRRRRMGLDGWRERNARATGQAVADWREAINAAQRRAEVPYGPVGYFGLSMGTRFGVPLIAAEPRIAVAVLGLFGIPAADTESDVARAARQVTIPLLFLQQRDDQLFSRGDSRALFDRLGSRDKTLRENPGGHLGIPRTEIGHAVEFLRRRLGGDDGDVRDVGGGYPDD